MGDRSLLDAFTLLFPDFGALFSGKLSGVNALFVILIWAIVLWFVMALARQSKDAGRRIKALNELISGQEPGRLVDQRQEVFDKAQKEEQPATVKHLWREFDETLVESPDGRFLWNTLDAEHFFNGESLAAGVIHNRVLAFLPSAMTALGVLGTFVGLTTGLNGLQLQTESNVDELTAGINTLVDGAAIAFMTSVWGVFMSLLSNLIRKRTERVQMKKIRSLQDAVDKLYKRHAPEQSLVRIMDSSGSSAESLNVLHEKIGESMQTAIRTLSDDMQESLTSSIDQALTPAMTALRESTTQQSAEVFESLVDKFSESFAGIGDKQAAQLEKSADQMVNAVADVSGQFKDMIDQAAAQSAEYRAEIQSLIDLSEKQREQIVTTLQTLSQEFESAVGKLSDSTSSLETSAESLDSVSDALTIASTGFSEKLREATDALGTVTEQQRDASEIFWEQANKLKDLEEALTGTSESLGRSSELISSGYEQMQQRQEEFLSSLGNKVSDLEEQMSNWLTSYQRDVSNQVSERMDDWNKHSHEYASQMLHTANALSTVIEEFEPALEAVRAATHINGDDRKQNAAVTEGQQ